MTYERVVVVAKASGPDIHHPIVEIAWWNLTTGDRGQFVPPHNPNVVLANCDLDTIDQLGYLTRIARAPQDTNGAEAYRLAEALEQATLVSLSPVYDGARLDAMFEHYRHDVRTMDPVWTDTVDVPSYAAGVLSLPTLPDLDQLCQYTGVPLEAVHTADSDCDAFGRAVLRLSELADNAARRDHAPVPAVMPAAGELAGALAARLNRALFDVVQLAEDGHTLDINTGLIGDFATEIYGPFIAAQRIELDRANEETERTNRQITELTDATGKLTAGWESQLAHLTRRLADVRAVPTTGQLRDQLAERFETSWEAIHKDDHPHFAAADAALLLVGPMLTAKAGEVADLTIDLDATRAERDKLDKSWQAQQDEIAELRASRQDWAIASMDDQLARDTAWDPTIVPATELSVGPDTHEPIATVGPHAVVVAPASPENMLIAAALVSPVKGGCPNQPGCGHPRTAHGIDTADDPIPVCWTGGCPDCPCGCSCGQPPAGFRRKPGQRVWDCGDTIPADVFVMDQAGLVWPESTGSSAGLEWTNHHLGPVVEIERVPDQVEPVDEVFPGAAEANTAEANTAEPAEVTG